MGLAAKHEIRVDMRQTFYSGNYAMIDKELNPRADYWLALVYKRLIGRGVLNITLNENSKYLRVYAHCADTDRNNYPAGAVTFFGLNLHSTEVKLRMDKSFGKVDVDQFILTPGSEG